MTDSPPTSLAAKFLRSRLKWPVLAATAVIVAGGIFVFSAWLSFRRHIDEPLAKFVPAGPSAVFMSRDLPSLLQRLDDSQAGRLLAGGSPDYRTVSALMRAFSGTKPGEPSVFKPETELRMLELLESDALVASMLRKGRTSSDVLLLSRVKFKHALAWPVIRGRLAGTPGFNGGVKDVGGHSCCVIRPDGSGSLALCISEGILVASSSEEVLAAALGLLDGGAGQSFKGGAGEPPASGFSLWCDLPAMRRDGALFLKLQKAFNCIPVREVLHPVELDAARTISVRGDFDDKGLRITATILPDETVTSPRITAMIATPKGAQWPLEYLPEDVFFASAFSDDPYALWNFGERLTKIEGRDALSRQMGEIMKAAYGQMGETMQRAEQRGCSDKVLPRLGPKFVIALSKEQTTGVSGKVEGAIGVSVIAEVTEPDQALAALDEFMASRNTREKKSEFTKRRYGPRDIEIREFHSGASVMGFSSCYAAVDRVLVFSSSPSFLEKLADMHDSAGGRALTGAAEFKRFKPLTSGSHCVTQFVSFSKLAAALDGFKTTIAGLETDDVDRRALRADVIRKQEGNNLTDEQVDVLVYDEIERLKRLEEEKVEEIVKRFNGVPPMAMTFDITREKITLTIEWPLAPARP